MLICNHADKIGYQLEFRLVLKAAFNDYRPNLYLSSDVIDKVILKYPMLKNLIIFICAHSSVLLVAQEPILVKDFNTGRSDAFNTSNFKAIEIDDKLIFPITSADSGEELGIAENGNIRILKDLNPGLPGSKPTSFIKYRDRILFTAYTPEHQGALWETDGTEAGTRMLFAPGNSTIHRPQGLITDRSGNLYFTYGNDLYMYDGGRFHLTNASISFTTNLSKQGVNYCRYKNGLAFTEKEGTTIKLFILKNGAATVQARLRDIDFFGRTYGIAEVKGGVIFNFDYQSDKDTGTYLFKEADRSLTRLTVDGEPALFERILPVNENYAIVSSTSLGTYGVAGLDDEMIKLSNNFPDIQPDQPWANTSNGDKVIFNLSTDEDTEQYLQSDGSKSGTETLLESRNIHSSNIILIGNTVYVSAGINSGGKPHIHNSNLDIGSTTTLFKSEEVFNDNNNILMLGVAHSRLYFSAVFDPTIGRELYFIPLSMDDLDEDGFIVGIDCDDSDPSIYPGAPEILDNDIDENCDGVFDLSDADQDGYDVHVDCNDFDPAINPGATEIINNDIDEDCDGVISIIDNDNDGYHIDIDCDDYDNTVYPDAEEIPNNDIDENCDGEVLYIDNDNDGFNSDLDCDDNNPNINGAAIEIPNNDVDEDCDGQALIIDNDRDGYNSDRDCDDNNPSIYPEAVEIIFNGIDEDCNGEDATPFSLSVDNYAVQIFPNPSTDYLNIILLDGDGDMILRAFSTSGKLLIDVPLSTQNRIDISNWPQGIILVEILHKQTRNRAYIKQIKL